ncbi:uncharacterized protein LOC135357201 [Latimeria chalumnae]|uniref:uncharacterized protein LOC135357201 n=1 Tax=Latimeria chalumnae TaxID=7897 RepID=UPI00313C4F2E
MTVNLFIHRLMINWEKYIGFYRVLQMDGESLWSEEVLFEFENLKDFTAQELQALQGILGNSQQMSKYEGPLCVRKCLCSFQDLPKAREKLRTVAEHLKNLGRNDVVKAMHQEQTLLRYLGPRQKESLCIKDMKFSVRHEFTLALSVEEPGGKDWRYLADKFGAKPYYIDLWKQKYPNPADEVLKIWQSQISKATVGALFDLLLAMGREDLAAML